MSSVVHHSGHDYWRTWFIDECEEAGLFGAMQKHLGLIRLAGPGVRPYQVGTQVYLEDAPWFHHLGMPDHRVLGPYVVVAADPLPLGATPVHSIDGATIAYLEAIPSSGPWFNRTVTRFVDGQRLHYRQTAGQFDFYPFRFRIKRAPRHTVTLMPHLQSDCWLCR